MPKRSSLQLKKEIIAILKKHGELSLRDLDIKVNTNYKTIREHVSELEFFEKVKVTTHKKNKKTGRPYTSVSLV